MVVKKVIKSTKFQKTLFESLTNHYGNENMKECHFVFIVSFFDTFILTVWYFSIDLFNKQVGFETENC